MDDDGKLPLMAQQSPDDEINDALRVARETLPQSSQDRFLKEQLAGSAPQYDPNAGMETAKEAGRALAGMTTPGAIADAAGYLGSPSALQNIREGNYGTAALQVAGAIPGVGPLAKAARIAEEAKALKSVAPATRVEFPKTDPALLTVHNVRSYRLPMAERLGGAPVPSLAIINPEHGFKSFGDITMVGSPEMARPSRTNPVFASDVYSPRFPSIEDDGERIFRGFTPSGYRRYAPLNMENVVREMKGNIRGGEGGLGFYGAGSLRSQVTPQFKTLESIKKSRGKIISEKEFDPLKDQANERLEELASKFYPYSKYSGDEWRHTNSFIETLSDIARGRHGAWAQDYENLPKELKEEAMDYLKYLRNMPTEYFEAKPQRAVGYGEFEGAIVPQNIIEEVSPALERLGTRRIVPFNPEEENAQQKAFEFFRPHFFSTGGTASGTMNDDIIQDALRIADSRLGRADGGEIPTPPRRPDDLEHYAVMADAQKKFPFINKYDPHIKVEPREGDQNFSEFYNAEETGDPKNPSDARPEEFPYGSSGVRVYKPEKFTAADYAAEYLHGDPVANKTREELISRLTPEQLELIKGQPDYQESVKLGLPEERALNNVVDAMMRGYVMQDEPSNQWPKHALAELEFTPEELELLNSLQDYVEAPAQAAPSPEAAPAEETPERKLGGKINTIIDRDPDWRMGFDDGGLVDAHTGLPPKEDWTELVSRQEYGRRLEQGVPLREMAAHERYLEENPHKLRSLSEHIIRMLPTGQYNVPMAYPDRAPPLKRFAHGGEVSDALRVARSRLAYGGLPDSYMDDDRYKVFQQMGGTRTDPRSEAIGRFLPRMTYHESRDRPLAGAKTSSAAGLAQFTRPTWRKITEGEPEVAGKSREELYAMRRDPSEEGQRFHMRMAEKLANENADKLEKAGLPVTPQNLYAAHFGGPHGVQAAAAPAGTPLSRIFNRGEIRANPFLRGQTAEGFRKFAQNAISETPRGLPMDLEFKRSQLPANRYEGLQTAMAGAQPQTQPTPPTQMAYAKPEQRGFSPDLMTQRPAPQPTQMARLPDMNVGGQRAMAADRGPMEGPGPKMAQDRGPMVPETQMAMAQPMPQQAPEIEQASYQPEPERPNQDMLEGLEQPFVGWPDFASLFADGGVVSDALRLATGGRTPAWTRAEGKSKTGGLNAKGRASYNRANPGKPGLKPPAPHPKTEKDAGRRKSFCSRMTGLKKKLTSSETANDPNSRVNKSLRAWNCADGGQVWDKPRPKHLGEPKPLSTKQKKSAKAAAKAAGRPWPNMIDSINASKK